MVWASDMVGAILIMDMVLAGVTLIMDMVGIILIMDMAGAILVMAGVIPDMATPFMDMDITIIILTIPVEEVLHMPMGFMATIDILKIQPIRPPEEQTIRISEEVPPPIAQPETVHHL